MSRWTPCKRRDFIEKARKLGFEGPYPGARHQFLVYRTCRLAIPFNSEYSVPQLKMMINEMEKIFGKTITLKKWTNL